MDFLFSLSSISLTKVNTYNDIYLFTYKMQNQDYPKSQSYLNIAKIFAPHWQLIDEVSETAIIYEECCNHKCTWLSFLITECIISYWSNVHFTVFWEPQINTKIANSRPWGTKLSPVVYTTPIIGSAVTVISNFKQTFFVPKPPKGPPHSTKVTLLYMW